MTSKKETIEVGASSEKPKLTNFLAKYRDEASRDWSNFTAHQFQEVWNHYDSDGNGYIEGNELDDFLREFITSALPQCNELSDSISDTAFQAMKENFMAAYDENEDNRLEIGELAQILPTDETFLLLFRRDNPLESSVDFMRLWHEFDEDNSGFIEEHELRQFLKRLLTEAKVTHVTEAQLDEYAATILRLFDDNGDRKLQLSEMARLLPVKENPLAKPMFKKSTLVSEYDIRRILKKYDEDKSGTIENEELDGFLKDLLDFMGEEYNEETLNDLRNLVDLDRDGTVQISELETILLQHRMISEQIELVRQKRREDAAATARENEEQAEEQDS